MQESISMGFRPLPRVTRSGDCTDVRVFMQNRNFRFRVPSEVRTQLGWEPDEALIGEISDDNQYLAFTPERSTTVDGARIILKSKAEKPNRYQSSYIPVSRIALRAAREVEEPKTLDHEVIGDRLVINIAAILAAPLSETHDAL